MEKIICNICSKTIRSDGEYFLNTSIVITFKNERPQHICSEDCLVILLQKRKIDREFHKNVEENKS